MAVLLNFNLPKTLKEQHIPTGFRISLSYSMYSDIINKGTMMSSAINNGWFSKC